MEKFAEIWRCWVSQAQPNLRSSPYFRQHRRQIIIATAFCLSGCANVIKNPDTKTGKQFKNMIELRGLARSQIIPRTPLGGGPRLSLPVPVHRENQTRIAYMICFYTFSPEGSWIYPPNKVAWLDPVNGELTEQIPVTPAYFGQTDQEGRKFNYNLSIPQDMMDGWSKNSKDYLFELYDALFPAWAAGSSTSDETRLRGQARAFLKIFNEVSEPPLRPYYESLGHDWFDWLRKVAE